MANELPILWHRSIYHTVLFLFEMTLTMIRQQIHHIFRQTIAGVSFKTLIIAAAGLAICCEAVLMMQNGRVHPSAEFPHYDRVCKVNLDVAMEGVENGASKTPARVAGIMLDGLPEVEMATRAYHPGAVEIRRQGSAATPVLDSAPRLLAVDPDFVEMFGFAVAAGDAWHCLSNDAWVVLNESLATQLFGSAEKAVGQPVMVGKIQGLVTVVLKDLPENSPVHFDVLVPITNFKVVERNAWNWAWLQVDTWVRLHEQPFAPVIAGIEAQLPGIIHDDAAFAFAKTNGDFDQMLAAGGRFDLQLEPVSPPVDCEVAVNTGCTTPSKRFTFGVLGFHLKNIL